MHLTDEGCRPGAVHQKFCWKNAFNLWNKGSLESCLHMVGMKNKP